MSTLQDGSNLLTCGLELEGLDHQVGEVFELYAWFLALLLDHYLCFMLDEWSLAFLNYPHFYFGELLIV